MNPLRRVKRLFDKIFGTVVDKIYWKGYYLFVKEDIEENLSHPYKKILLNAISNSRPFETVLEVGCGTGFNLYELAKKFPDKKFYGIDVSGMAIKQGEEFLKKNNIKNVFLKKTSAEDLSFLKDNIIDTVFSYAAIMYIGPDRIERALKEIMRVAEKNIILCEHHVNNKIFYDDHWVYDYSELFKKYFSDRKVEIIKLISKENKDDWEKFGHIIKIKLK